MSKEVTGWKGYGKDKIEYYSDGSSKKVGRPKKEGRRTSIQIYCKVLDDLRLLAKGNETPSDTIVWLIKKEKRRLQKRNYYKGSKYK